MRLIQPSVEIMPHMPSDLAMKLIERAGRVCYKSEDKITDDSAEKFVKMILSRGHEAVVEHISITAKFICDRGVSHELVRHRLASYCQESTRYCDYNGGHVEFILPPWVMMPHGTIIVSSDDIGVESPGGVWLYHMFASELAYKEVRNMGWEPQKARSVLPNSLKTEVVMTANIREWRHFFKLRCAEAAHPQMREVAKKLLLKMQVYLPGVF